MTAPPSSSIDLFADAVLHDPYPVYAELRKAGPAVHLTQHGVWAIPRHPDIKAILHTPGAFGSAGGVALTELANTQVLVGTVLAADAEAHVRLRRVLSAQLAPRAIRRLVGTVTERADRLVSEHVAHGNFDAAVLARAMVCDTVMELMGLPEETRQFLLTGAAATFDVFGPDNTRYQRALPVASRMVEFLHETVTRETVTPDSWMGAIFQAVDEGKIKEADAIPLASAYTAASMDTTILGITAAIAQLARHPLQWEDLRRNPVCATPAFHEALRLEAPIQGFGRIVSKTVEIGDVRLDPGEQVWLLYGSAGRDRVEWGSEADAFNIRRHRVDRHLAFGAGPHLCAGIPLAELQARAVLRALAAHCTRLTITGEPVRVLNNLLRGWGLMPIVAELSSRTAVSVTVGRPGAHPGSSPAAPGAAS
ncbi:cytochrome P450 [Streptomyces violens]|uniref:cytochrome P450 n=1 Tax=Streptomyces violens TaxID=66377 RepID=UPI0009981DB2|nr:cytochrome P450 [Streptomyces violens]